MTCWFHKWEVVHHDEPLEGFWFEDRKCKKCGKEEIVDSYPFFSSISDCATLGANIGCYKALGRGKVGKMIDEEIDRQLRAKGLTRADLKVQRTKSRGCHNTKNLSFSRATIIKQQRQYTNQH